MNKKVKTERNVYIIKIEDDTQKKKTIIIILMVLLLIVELVLIIFNIIQVIQKNKVYNEYNSQLITIQKQKENDDAKIAEEKERKRQEKLPKLTDEGRKNVDNIYHSEKKRAFLTFDDGPSPITSTILDILKQEEIKATFFVLGSRVEVMPDVVKRMYNEGHYIANHGYSHIYSSIYSSPQAVLDEFNKCNQLVRDAIGEQEYNSHLFRFPGGFVGGKYADIKNQAKELLNQNDIVNVDWNALVGDAEISEPTLEFEMTRLEETTENKNSVVILMHDAQAKKVTSDSLTQIIAYLREQGYEFKNFYEIIK